MGEATPGVLAPGEALEDRRRLEIRASAEALGAEEPRLLGYRDSGMMGEEANQHPDCFWQAEPHRATERMVDALADVDVDVLTIYDDHGLYGHPDHIQVHRVGLLAAELLGVEHVYDATVNRDRAREGFARLAELAGPGIDLPDSGPDGDLVDFGVPDADLAFSVDVTAQPPAKRAAMRAHRSQIADESFFLALPDEAFALMFGTEWYAVPGLTGGDGPKPVELLPGF